MLQLPRSADCWNHLCWLGPQGRSPGNAAMLTSLLLLLVLLLHCVWEKGFTAFWKILGQIWEMLTDFHNVCVREKIWNRFPVHLTNAVCWHYLVKQERSCCPYAMLIQMHSFILPEPQMCSYHWLVFCYYSFINIILVSAYYTSLCWGWKHKQL